MTNRTLIIIILVILIVVGIGGYWFWSKNMVPQPVTTADQNPPQFVPLNRPGQSNTNQTGQNGNGTSTGAYNTSPSRVAQLPVLRLISNTPIGGYAASTTASTTLIRWIDRGRGNIYETKSNTLDVKILSTTLLPRVYNSVWNKSAMAFIGMMLPGNTATPSALYATLTGHSIAPVASTTARMSASTTATAIATPTASPVASFAPYDLKGKQLPDNTTAIAASPAGDRIFFLVKEGIGSSGYTANFDGTKVTKIFTTPLTQLNVEWPVNNILAITTKGNSTEDGFLYFVNPSTGVWKKVLGPYAGLSTRVSHDGKHVLISTPGQNSNVVTNIYTVASGSGTDAVINTLADKCAWGNFYKDLVYCAVPFQPVLGTYPDDWYTGILSTVDKMWEVNATTGEVRMVGQIIGQAGRVIDAFNLGLDSKDSYLFFMNKNDLSFWSLDLVRSN